MEDEPQPQQQQAENPPKVEPTVNALPSGGYEVVGGDSALVYAIATR